MNKKEEALIRLKHILDVYILHGFEVGEIIRRVHENNNITFRIFIEGYGHTKNNYWNPRKPGQLGWKSRQAAEFYIHRIFIYHHKAPLFKDKGGCPICGGGI